MSKEEYDFENTRTLYGIIMSFFCKVNNADGYCDGEKDCEKCYFFTAMELALNAVDISPKAAEIWTQLRSYKRDDPDSRLEDRDAITEVKLLINNPFVPEKMRRCYEVMLKEMMAEERENE